MADFTPAQPATESLCPRCDVWVIEGDTEHDSCHAPASEVPDLAAGIERVLGEHRPQFGDKTMICLCGHNTDAQSAERIWTDHAAHVASAVIAYLHRKGYQ